MKMQYKNNQIAITWKHKITKHIVRGRNITVDSVQYITSLTKQLIDLANIRKLIFIYKNPETQEYHLTIHEPPIEAEYEVIKTRNGGNQQTIQLPRRFLKLTDNQTATIKYYPAEPDYYDPTLSKITLTIKDLPIEEKESTAQIMPTNPPTLQWNIKYGEIPFDLEQFLTKKHKKTIQETQNTTAILNLQTLDITLTGTNNE